MALFLSTTLNKLDKKGRVSVPASFRAGLVGQDFQGVVLFRSSTLPALEGFDWATMSELSKRLDHFDLFSESQDDLATAIFGDSVALSFDQDGRIVLPEVLMVHANLKDEVAFVGLGRKFQIWHPKALEARRAEAQSNIRKKGLTIPALKTGGES